MTTGCSAPQRSTRGWAGSSAGSCAPPGAQRPCWRSTPGWLRRVLESFAASLERDGAAVRAALSLPWRSGQAEGQINRLKLLKRSMDGRAKLDLLVSPV